jgi:hypothetical protein
MSMYFNRDVSGFFLYLFPESLNIQKFNFMLDYNQ